jgi:hypothetical protein
VVGSKYTFTLGFLRTLNTKACIADGQEGDVVFFIYIYTMEIFLTLLFKGEYLDK